MRLAIRSMHPNSLANLRPPFEADHTNGWQKGQSGNPSGRPMKFLTEIRKAMQDEDVDERIDTEAIRDTYLRALALPYDRVIDLAWPRQGTNIPALLKYVCRAIVVDIEKGDTMRVEALLSRAIGKTPSDEQSTTVQNSIINIQVINNDHETAQDVSEVIQGIQATRHPNDNRGGGLEIGQDVQHNDVSTSNGAGAGASR